MANPLLTFLQGGGSSNDAVRLAGLRNQQMLETRDPTKQARLHAEMEADPFTGQDAQAEVAKQDALGQMLQTYNRPDVARMRESELAGKERLATAPARVAGQYNVEAAGIAGRERALLAEQNMRARNAQQNATVQARQQQQAQTQRNALLEGQAKGAEKTGESPYNPLRWLMGRPTGEQQAATLRGQQNFTAPTSDGSDEMDLNGVAQELMGKYPGSSPEQIAALAESEFDGLTPEDLQQLQLLVSGQ